MPEIPDQQLPDYPQENRKINWATVTIVSSIIIFILIILILAYWFFVLRPQVASQPPLPAPTKKVASPSAEPYTPSSTKDETADWKTYTNEKYKYSLKYPQDYELIISDKNDVNAVTISWGERKFHVYAGNFELPIVGKCQEEDYDFGGFKVQRHSCVGNDPSIGKYIWFGGGQGSGYDDTPAIVLFFYEDPQDVIIFDQVLSTFKFLSSASSE